MLDTPGIDASSASRPLRCYSRWLWVASFWAGVILFACWLPTHRLPVPEDSVVRWRFPHFDKVIHFGLFAIFGVLGRWGAQTRRGGFLVILAGLTLAAVSELGQELEIVGRDADILDFTADAAGVFLGVGLGKLLPFRTIWPRTR